MVVSIVSQQLGFCLLRRHRIASLMVTLSHTFSLTMTLGDWPSLARPMLPPEALGWGRSHLPQGPCVEGWI